MLVSTSLRKKGGIFIKKSKFFLILLLVLLIGSIYPKSVQAESTQFYEGDYINGIYLNRYNPETRTIYYQQARFFRKTGTNEFAYCLEPFTFFQKNSTYSQTTSISNISEEQMKRIALIAHFGYGYQNHTDVKWYPITQILIWKEAFPFGDYFFSNGTSGERLNLFEEEMNEIYSLVSEYQDTPTVLNKEYTIIEGENLTLNVPNENEMLKTDSDKVVLSNKQLITKNLKKGTYDITIKKEDSFYNKPYLIYQSETSQALLMTGDLEKLEYKLKINVIHTELQITKIDKDTKSITPSGSAILDNSIFIIMDMNKNEISKEIVENNTILLENLPLGKYYVEEIEPGEGYQKNDKIYEVEITEEKPVSELIIENEVIKKKITIEKKYGENANFLVEKYISFQIWNENKELVDTITTNEEGIAEITLPYGSYTFIQLNSKEGYQKIDPFTIEVKEKEEEKIELKDYKIPVPDTHTNKSFWQKILSFLLNIL